MNMCIYKLVYAILAAIHPQRKARKDFRRLKNDLKSACSYSQEGEDLILQRIFHNQKDGFYIDVGAHHPFRFSNTALLYKKNGEELILKLIHHNLNHLRGIALGISI